jgi:hypothetical protein
MSLNDLSTWKSSCRIAVWLLSTVIAVSLAGCGESNPLSGIKVYPVKGKVSLADGKPLAAGKIVFAATKSTITSSANIEGDGSFTFKGASGNGLPEGEYKVRLETDGATKVKKGTAPFPSKFLDEDSSGLSATVKPDETSNDFDFKLTPK